MTKGDTTHEQLPPYAELGPEPGHGEDIAGLGREPTVEGVAPEGGDLATETAAGGAKKDALTSGPTDPANIAGREGEFERRTGNEGSETAGTRS